MRGEDENRDWTGRNAPETLADEKARIEKNLFPKNERRNESEVKNKRMTSQGTVLR
jgi:hypothetical protein